MVYLDNAATTPMDAEVVERVHESMRDIFANSGTRYRIGLDAKRLIEKSTELIAEYLGIPSTHRIVFTSGGTESNNLFIKGLCFPDKKTAFLGLEHPSITESLAFLQQFGNEPFFLLPFQTEGRLDLNSVSTLKEKRVKLLCLSHVNNELGTVNEPLQIISALANESPQTKLFLDGVQAVGKLKLDRDMWRGLAGYSISGHKIHGPKGIGLLIYDSKLVLNPQMHGGKQQFGVRSGTLPVPLIVGLETAIKHAVMQTEQTQKHLQDLCRHLVQGLKNMQERLPELRIRFNSLVDETTPPVIIISSLYREIKSLVTMSVELKHNESIEAILEKHRVWQKRKPLISNALNKHSYQLVRLRPRHSVIQSELFAIFMSNVFAVWVMEITVKY